MFGLVSNLKCKLVHGYIIKKYFNLGFDCNTTPHYTRPHQATKHYTKLHHATPYNTILHYTVLHNTTPCCTTPHLTTSHFSTLHHIASD